MFETIKRRFVRIRIYRMGRIYGMDLNIQTDLVVLQRNRVAKFRVDEVGVLIQFRGSVEVANIGCSSVSLLKIQVMYAFYTD